MKPTKISILFLLVILCLPVASFSADASSSQTISSTYFVFGRIDGYAIIDYGKTTVLEGRHVRAFGRDTWASSFAFEYDVVRRNGILSFTGYSFNGILRQHFVCGTFYGSIETASIGGVDAVRSPIIPNTGAVFSIAKVRGKINSPVHYGNIYGFIAENVKIKEHHHMTGVWGVRIIHARSQELITFTGYSMMGRMTETRIRAIFLYTAE